MPNRINSLMYKNFTERYRNSPILVLFTNKKLSANDARKLRVEVRNEKCRIQNIRNRILNLLLKNEMGIGNAASIMKGSTLVLYGDEPSMVAKIALKLARKTLGVEISGVIMEKRVMGPDAMKMISNLPTRTELIATVIAQSLAPFRRVAAQVAAPVMRVAGQIKKISEKEEESPDAKIAVG